MARQAIPLKSGPYRGMRFVSDAQVVDEEYCYYALNMLPADRSRPSPYMRFFSYGVTDTTLAGALQGYEPFQALEDSIVVIGGQLYKTKTWSTTPWVATAALTGAGITLDSSALVYMCEFNGQLIVSDGVNTPFAVDTAAALTKLTNAPVFFGQPTVYAGKLMGIKSADRKTLVWSEENLPNLGYEAGGYNNAWTLTQGGPGDLYAIRGTNAGLYYWRAESCGAIRGAITPDFVAASTHDDISRQVGSVSTRTLLVEQDIWFVDQLARPQRIVGGVLQPNPPGGDIADAFTDTGTPMGVPAASRSFAEARLGYDKRHQLVVCQINDALGRNRFWVFDAASGQALCELTPDPGLTGATWQLAAVGSTTGFATLLMLIGQGSGNVFLYRPPGSGGTYYAASGASHQPTEWSVTTPPLAAAPGVASHCVAVEAELDVQGGAAGGAVTLAANPGRSIGVVTDSLGSQTVGVQATRRDFRVEWGTGRWARWHQFKVSGNDSLGYWAVRRVAARVVPEAAGALVR